MNHSNCVRPASARATFPRVLECTHFALPTFCGDPSSRSEPAPQCDIYPVNFFVRSIWTFILTLLTHSRPSFLFPFFGRVRGAFRQQSRAEHVIDKVCSSILLKTRGKTWNKTRSFPEQGACLSTGKALAPGPALQFVFPLHFVSSARVVREITAITARLSWI